MQSERMPQQGSHQDRPLVIFENVSKSYDGKVDILRDMSLEIRRGEFLTLLGPSGSGKSTSLMLLAGFEEPSSGQIYLNGSKIAHVPAYKRNIGMVFQNYALFPHMTVAENVGYPLKVRGISKGEISERVAKALDMVQMQRFADRSPALLSGGQQQRVAVSRAMVFEPELILMDEPLGALDKRLREDLQLEIKHLHAQLGLTIVYVTHDQSEALTMSDRIAIFNNGKIEQLDTPSGLYENPATPFVASFIGDNNAIPAQVIAIEGEMARLLVEDGGKFIARVGPSLRPGQAAVISVRPEKISLSSAALTGEMQLSAFVRDRIYLGDHLHFYLETPSGIKFVVKQLNQTGSACLKSGESCFVAWAPEDSIALALS